VISCALVNVSATISTTYKPEVENVYEQVIVSSSLASLRSSSLLVENSARRENALLLLTNRIIDKCGRASEHVNGGLIGEFAAKVSKER